jgi:hypothetical protein
MPTIEDLKVATKEFFTLHWLVKDVPVPEWWPEPYKGRGHIPFASLPGCYALERECKIVYVGSGVGRGNDRYPGHGLVTRVHQYTMRDREAPGQKEFRPRAFRFGHTAIYTIGFQQDFAYMVPALECYLIDRFIDTLENRRATKIQPRPNKAPEPTPGAVTPRATEGTSK